MFGPITNLVKIGSVRIFRVGMSILIAVGFLCGLSVGATAASAKFMGVPIEPAAGTYEVVKDANVRARPETKSRRLGGLRQGTKIEAVGKAKGSWVAVRQGGKDLGFVYLPLLKVVSLPPVEKDDQGRILDAQGEPLSPASGYFLSISDVNLRAKPSTRAQKRGRLERGSRVEAIGAAENGSWFFVRRGEQELGFVFAETLLPLIDGTLDAPLTGMTESGSDRSCRYLIRFVGKNLVEGELFETSDYEVDWECALNDKQITFPGYMFITEAPFQLSENRVYQISIDLLNVTREYDEVFSTIFLYRLGENEVVLDSVSMKEYGVEPKVARLAARTVAEALAAAAKIAPRAWNDTVWSMLASNGM